MAQEIVQLGLYQGPLPTPPLKVPPEDVSLWTDVDTKIFQEWSKWVTKGSDSKKKKRRSKDRRQKRLLKFQEKLVMTHGLPPSRLMVGKRLPSEFEQLAGVASTPSTGSPSIAELNPLQHPL